MIKFIADIGSNHNNDKDRIEKLIKKCKEIGCWGVKFQLFKADKLYAPGFIPEGLKENELDEELIPFIACTCDYVGLEFGCTPFYNEAVDILNPWVDFFKISSYEILRKDLIQKCAETNKPLHISTGLASHEEIYNVVPRDRFGDDNMILYHCCAKYPAPFNLCNMEEIKDDYAGYPYGIYGYSDHTRRIAPMLFAIAYGVEYIEFHIDLEGRGNEYKHGHCWMPWESKYMIKTCQESTQLLLPVKSDEEERLLRADPEDGLRPHKIRR